MRIALLALPLLAAITPANAKDIQVKMLNKGAEGAMVFEPAFVRAQPGDTVTFVPTDPSHNAETMATMLPAGVTPIKGKLNEKLVLPVSKPGLYGIKCQPHYSMGMVALVQVGKVTPEEVAAARAVKLPPFAAKRMTPMLDQVK